jgi:selenocysteine lyase/cysteine desulfurase
MKPIYLDNVHNSFPKAPNLFKNLGEFFLPFDNINNFETMYNASKAIVSDTRFLICKLLNFNKPNNVIFTRNSAEALNILLKGFFKKGDHAIISSLETNSILRPLNSLINLGVDISKVPCNNLSEIDINAIPKLINKHTRAIVISYTSNICGINSPLKEIKAICNKYNLALIVDCSSAVGTDVINMEELDADAVVFSANKYLLGPDGCGGFLIKDELSKLIEPLIEGNVFLDNELDIQPDMLPFKYENGSLDYLSIKGLNLALTYVLNEGITSIKDHNLYLTKYFINEILNIKNCRVIGTEEFENRTPVVSICFNDIDSLALSSILRRDFFIIANGGLQGNAHCHKILDTYSSGTLRLSFGYFNTLEEIKYTIDSINKALKNI